MARRRLWRLELVDSDGTTGSTVGSFLNGLKAVERAFMLRAPARVVNIPSGQPILLVVPCPGEWPLVSAAPAGYRAITRVGRRIFVNEVQDLEHPVTPLPSPDAVRARWAQMNDSSAVEAAASPADRGASAGSAGLQGGAATPVSGSEPALAGGMRGPAHGCASDTGTGRP